MEKLSKSNTIKLLRYRRSSKSTTDNCNAKLCLLRRRRFGNGVHFEGKTRQHYLAPENVMTSNFISEANHDPYVRPG